MLKLESICRQNAEFATRSGSQTFDEQVIKNVHFWPMIMRLGGETPFPAPPPPTPYQEESEQVVQNVHFLLALLVSSLELSDTQVCEP